MSTKEKELKEKDLIIENKKLAKKVFCVFCHSSENTYEVFENKLYRCKKCYANICL